MEIKINQDIKQYIDSEISKAIFFHTKALEHRIEQFIFDMKIALKNKDKDYFEIVNTLQDDLTLWKK
jgi:hypothetical protein